MENGQTRSRTTQKILQKKYKSHNRKMTIMNKNKKTF